MPTRFDDDTALRPVAPGRWGGRIDRGWWIERGPNGGYVAAIVLRALWGSIAHDDRPPRSLTIHYTAPPVEGPIEVETTVERDGRGLTSVSGRLVQDGRLCALALAAFGRPRPGPTFADAAMPVVPPLAACPPMTGDDPLRPPIVDRYDQRPALGGVPQSGDVAVSGGWIALAEPRPLDPLLAAAFMDAWLPPVFVRTTEPVAVPTVDLTIHFRRPLPPPGTDPSTHYVVRFESRVAADGFIEEDGELWSPDGSLLAQSRQLAVILARG